MLQELELQPNDRVLEIGTGSGYEAAVLSKIVKEVCSIEIDPLLTDRAREILEGQGIENVKLKCGDGYAGWKEEAPFDAIIISAAPPEIPRELVAQLGQDGRMILPFGETVQELVLVKRSDGALISRELGGVHFVPMRRGE
jgi:protein-L-isoaspartate(D-aspartate) O-methyltransferase